MKVCRFIKNSIREAFLLPLLLITLSACNFTGNQVRNISRFDLSGLKNNDVRILLSGKSHANHLRANENLGKLDSVENDLLVFEVAFESAFAFLAELYDPETGGFYESLSEKNDPDSHPRLEPTGRAVSLLHDGNILPNLPVSIRDNITGFIQALQDPKNGFFDDPNERAPLQKRRGRGIAYAVNSLRLLGAEPLYPLPGESPEKEEAINYLLDRKAFLSWADEVKLNPPGSVGSAVSAQKNIINTLPEPERSRAIDMIFDWLAGEQNPVTGLWWSDNRGLYGAISNTFKVSLFYKDFNRPIPNAEKIYRNLLHCIRTEEATQAIFVRNPLSLFLALEPQIPVLTDEERKDIIRISINNILAFRAPDGGFAIKKGETEGATDAFSQARVCYYAIRHIGGLPEIKLHGGNAFIARLSARGITARKSGFPVYDDQRIERPAGLPHFKHTDFNLNPSRIKRYANEFLYGNKKTLRQLSNFLLNDAAGRDLWEKETLKAARVLNRWDFLRSDLEKEYLKTFGTDRYVYRIYQLENLSVIYLLTGHKELGQFIRAHMLQIADLPLEFWLHSELRGYNPGKPLGMLETSVLCSSIALSLSATPDLYSSSEKNFIETALRNKGLQPCLNWLENPRLNNFTGVISGGTYVAAKYYNDPAGMDRSLEVMKDYVNGSFETDGSYGEGLSYFDYPVRSLFPAFFLMNNTERDRVFSSSGLRRSSSWMVYPYLYAVNSDGKIQPTVVHFSDNTYTTTSSQSVNLSLSLLYNDSMASWLMNKFEGKLDFLEKLMVLSFKGKIPEPKSPDENSLPLLKVFDSGDCFIRSGWNDNAIVLALWSGDGSRVKYSHQRPEMSSVSMGAYGEYLIVSAGSASYRSSLRSQWDRTTRAANTITIDDKNQLFPGKASSEISSFWQEGQPKAEVIKCEAGELADILVNEAAQAYHIPMKNMRRSILFVRDPGYFVIIDRMEALNSQHKYTWRIHLNNKDEKGILKNITQNHWHFSRPLASLDIYLFSDQKLNTNIGKGYLHGPGRDYSPGGVYEGRPGSSLELEAFNPEKLQSLTYYSVLFPSQYESFAPAVEFSGNKMVVGEDILTFTEGECVIKKGGRTEKYKLW